MYGKKKKMPAAENAKETPPAWGDKEDDEPESELEEADEYQKSGSAYDKVNQIMGNYISSGKDALHAQEAVGKATQRARFLANMRKGREKAKSAHGSQKVAGMAREPVPAKATKAA